MRVFMMLGIVLALGGCTVVRVDPLPASDHISEVCIQRNDRVIVPDFLQILEDGFQRNGFKTRVFDDKHPPGCDAMLTYTATRFWDITPYLTDAQLWLVDPHGNRIAYAQYHLRNHGGLALNKWASARSKMRPVIDKLLQQYHQDVDQRISEHS